MTNQYRFAFRIIVTAAIILTVLLVSNELMTGQMVMSRSPDVMSKSAENVPLATAPVDNRVNEMPAHVAEEPEPSEEELFKQMMEKRMQTRKELQTNFCEKYVTSDGNLHKKSVPLFSSKSSKLTFCVTPKTGSTSIKKMLFQIEDATDEKLDAVGHGKFSLQKEEEFFHKAQKNFAQVVQGSPEFLQDRTTVLVARHPFERLVSAYHSKIGPRDYANPFFDPITRKIAARYRKEGEPERKFATFAEFVDFITTVKGDADTVEPHWKPIEDYCNPCTIDYDVILHTETLNEDMRYLTMLEDLKGVTIPPPYDYTKTADSLNKLCRELPEITMLQVLLKYKMDFAMLGYDPYQCLLARNIP